jgi:endonuclease/exonuclease/phosphatase family metal-dependent hydrolase
MPFTLATYNVLDLFDATDAASRAHLDAKLSHLAAVLERANADVVALQEVGSAAVLRELALRVPALGYGEPLVGTSDARGIRCAVLSRAPVVEWKVHTAEQLPFPVFYEGDPPPFGARIPLRRGIVHARVEAGALGLLDLLVLHFKSNRAVPLKSVRGDVPPVTSRDYAEGHLRTGVWRSAEALFVRGLVDDLAARAPGGHVAVAGDFNDRPGSSVVRVVSGGGPEALRSCAELIPERARFSILHDGKAQEIDHLLVTPLLRERLQTARFLNEELRDHGAYAKERTDAPPLPESDHAPLVATFA